MAHINYRRKYKQNHHGVPKYYGKPSKSDRKLQRKRIRQRDRRLISHENYDDFYRNQEKNLGDTWWD